MDKPIIRNSEKTKENIMKSLSYWLDKPIGHSIEITFEEILKEIKE